jgi:hypothetical protein
MTMTRALLLTTAAVSRRLPPWKSSVLANLGDCWRGSSAMLRPSKNLRESFKTLHRTPLTCVPTPSRLESLPKRQRARVSRPLHQLQSASVSRTPTET